MTTSGIELAKLSFSGPLVNPVDVQLRSGLNVLFGASNTGKTFTLKALDFMLGGSKELPGIGERGGFDKAWLAANLPISGLVTLKRALAGGSLEMYSGDVVEQLADRKNAQKLSARHDPSNTENLSQLLLEELGFGTKLIAVDENGKQRSLSFRDLAKYSLVDETSIQSEVSPIESGQFVTRTAERSIFKLLLTGSDDSAIVPVVDKKTFRAATNGKLEVLDEMIAAIGEQLNADYPDAEELQSQSDRLEESWNAAQQELQAAQESIRQRLQDKRRIADQIEALDQRADEIIINLGRFEQLDEVYESDLKRLASLEEAGFLLSLSADRDCPLCGAEPANQKVTHGLDHVDEVRKAALAEGGKIRAQLKDLRDTVRVLEAEGEQVARASLAIQGELSEVELALAGLSPSAVEKRRRVDELLPERDSVRRGLSLIEQRRNLVARREALAAIKATPKSEKPKLGVPTNSAHEFAQKVSQVLAAWHFPGQLHVSFDETLYDLRIDGKNRQDNGKGVRAITHAAFKVALLLFCKERDLPHPGFLVLDTPLLTYRDPLTHREGELSADESALKQTSLKDYFFEHLLKNAAAGQFLIIENVDPPSGIGKFANVMTFAGNSTAGARNGLFPIKADPPPP